MFAWMERTSGPPNAGAAMATLLVLISMLKKIIRTPPPERVSELKKQCTEREWKEYLSDLRKKDAGAIHELRGNGLWKTMSRKEKKFMTAGPLTMKSQEFARASWLLPESIACFAWALSIISEIPPYDMEVDSTLLDKFPAETPEILIEKATLRPLEQIQKQRAIAERWHWRSLIYTEQKSHPHFRFTDDETVEEIIERVSTQAAADGEIPAPIDGDFTAFGKAYRDLTEEEFEVASLIAEVRHRALNWLCGNPDDM